MAIQGDIVKEYILRFPNTSTRTLADKIYKENKSVFPNFEGVRCVIRDYRGAKGENSRKRRKLDMPITPKFTIPEGDNLNYEPYIIPDKLRTGAILSDIHFPYHEKSVLETAIEYVYNLHPDFIVLNGDIIDFHKISDFERDPRNKNIKDEIEMLRTFLKELRFNFQKSLIVYKYGNHEERYDRYVMLKAPEIFDEETTLKSRLKLEENNIEIVDNKRIIRYSHLNIIHGHEYRFNISNPVNPARGIFLKTKKITTAGHFHQSSEHNATTINRDRITCWSSGCLCNLSPQFMPLNDWGHGFQTIKSNVSNMWKLTNHKIINNEII